MMRSGTEVTAALKRLSKQASTRERQMGNEVIIAPATGRSKAVQAEFVPRVTSSAIRCSHLRMELCVVWGVLQVSNPE